MPYTLGNTTKSVIAKGPEAEKLMQEFEIDGLIYVGQPVKLHADGNKVTALVNTDSEADCIGFSIQNGQSAYGEFVVVAMKGYAIVNMKVFTAITIVPGPVYFEDFDATADENLLGYTRITTVNTKPFIGWALENGVADAIIPVVISAGGF